MPLDLSIPQKLYNPFVLIDLANKSLTVITLNIHRDNIFPQGSTFTWPPDSDLLVLQAFSLAEHAFGSIVQLWGRWLRASALIRPLDTTN